MWPFDASICEPMKWPFAVGHFAEEKHCALAHRRTMGVPRSQLQIINQKQLKRFLLDLQGADLRKLRAGVRTSMLLNHHG